MNITYDSNIICGISFAPPHICAKDVVCCYIEGQLITGNYIKFCGMEINSNGVQALMVQHMCQKRYLC